MFFHLRILNWYVWLVIPKIKSVCAEGLTTTVTGAFSASHGCEPVALLLDHSFVPLDSLDVNNFRGCVSQLWYIWYMYMIVYAVTCFVGDSQWNLGLGATLWASRIKFPAGQGLWKMAWPIYSWFMIYRRMVIFHSYVSLLTGVAVADWIDSSV